MHAETNPPDAESVARWQLRPAVESDFPALWALDQVCFAPELAYSRRELRELMSARGGAAWLAERRPPAPAAAASPGPALPSGGTLLGFIVVHAGGAAGHVITLDVAPACRRQGIGAALLEIGERYCRRRGAARMRLETAVDNQPAQRFYARHGYRAVRRLRGYYSRELDAWLLEKPLAAAHESTDGS